MPRDFRKYAVAGLSRAMAPEDRQAREDLSALLADRPGTMGESPGPDLPRVPRPPLFESDPVVVGPDLTRQTSKLLKIAPNLRRHIGLVTAGFTGGDIEWLAKGVNAGTLPPSVLDRPGQTNVVGSFTPRGKWGEGGRGEISVDPRLQMQDQMGTLAHESAHARGWTGERGPTDLASLLSTRVFYPDEGERKVPGMQDALQALRNRLGINGYRESPSRD